ncbi:MAG: type II secretion system protein GspJ [Bdellovibrio sp.]
MKSFTNADSRGFTMIELMITITILATLTIMTAQAISQSIQAKGKLQDQIDDVSRLRDAMRLMERDVNLAFHYRDIEKELEDTIKKKNSGQNSQTPRTPTPTPTPVATPTTNREVPRQDPATHWIGLENNMDFVTLNNGRTVRNSPQADFVEVGYALKDCKNVREDRGASKCLWRRSSPYVDLDVTKGGDEVVLLENVSEFKLRYIGKGKQDWVSTWRTDTQGDAATKGKFPQAVEISLTIQKKVKDRNKKYSMQTVVPIHFPNNPEEGGSNAQGTQQNSANSQSTGQ